MAVRAFATQVTNRVEVVSMPWADFEFTADADGMPIDGVVAQVVSDHQLELFVVACVPTIGTREFELRLNRELHRGVDPVYPGGSPTEVYAAISVLAGPRD